MSNDYPAPAGTRDARDVKRDGERVRIKKDVRPYGGRIVVVTGRHVYPNGRAVVRVFAPTGGKHIDIREYRNDEVEPVARPKQ
jgi:hypothetical protein